MILFVVHINQIKEWYNVKVLKKGDNNQYNNTCKWKDNKME